MLINNSFVIAAVYSKFSDWYLICLCLDRWSYTLTVRRPEVRGQVVEVKTQITTRDYFNMLEQRDPFHLTIFKKRRCFLYNNQYFQLDVYQEPCHPRYLFYYLKMFLY